MSKANLLLKKAMILKSNKDEGNRVLYYANNKEQLEILQSKHKDECCVIIKRFYDGKE